MKNLKAPFLVIALLLNVLLVSAETSTHPPSPTAKTASAAEEDDDCEVLNNCEANFPIDQNIVFLVISGLALGLTVIYKNKNQIKKASI